MEPVHRTAVEGADAVEDMDMAGVRNADVLRGDEALVRARQAVGVERSRARAAIQAELGKIRPTGVAPAVEAEELRKEREAVAAHGGIVMKTAANE